MTTDQPDPAPESLDAAIDRVSALALEIKAERDAMQRRAEAAESDWQAAVAERDALLSALKAIVAMYGPSTDYSHDAAAAWRQAEAALASVEGK